MTHFKINYYNISKKLIESNFNRNKKKFDEINNILLNSSFLNILKDKKYLNDVKKFVFKEFKMFKTLVVLGVGGSSLGANALSNLFIQKRKKVFFFDNIDPIHFKKKILDLNINKIGFVIISKSGNTPETLSQFLSLIEFYKSKSLNKIFLKNILVITEKKNNPLRKIAKKLNCKILDHIETIGGRYSVFSNVGLIPACFVGININKFCEGALEITSEIQKNIFKDHLFGAETLSYFELKKLTNINVMMTYSDSLYFFGKWYLQLWAESIGKKKKGATPLHAVGATDQHSQLQLFLDGPKDKFFTIITTNHKNTGLKMNNEILKNNNLDFLINRKMGDLMHAEQKATLDTLIKNKMPLREIYCEKIDEYTLGQLMAYFMSETIACCLLINVNPFDQPSIEQGKKLTRKYLKKI